MSFLDEKIEGTVRVYPYDTTQVTSSSIFLEFPYFGGMHVLHDQLAELAGRRSTSRNEVYAVEQCHSRETKMIYIWFYKQRVFFGTEVEEFQKDNSIEMPVGNVTHFPYRTARVKPSSFFLELPDSSGMRSLHDLLATVAGLRIADNHEVYALEQRRGSETSTTYLWFQDLNVYFGTEVEDFC